MRGRYTRWGWARRATCRSRVCGIGTPHASFTFAARNQPLTAIQNNILANAGYPDSPGVQTVYFGDRGTGEFAGYGNLNASVNYNVPVFKALRPWIKLDLFNLFDNRKLIAWNTTVSQNRAAGVDNLWPRDELHAGREFRQGDGQHAVQRVPEQHRDLPAGLLRRQSRRPDDADGDRVPFLT